jgi:hypothetical protein
MAGFAAPPFVSVVCNANQFCGRPIAYIPDEDTRPQCDPFNSKDRVLDFAAATATATDTGDQFPGVTWRIKSD